MRKTQPNNRLNQVNLKRLPNNLMEGLIDAAEFEVPTEKAIASTVKEATKISHKRGQKPKTTPAQGSYGGRGTKTITHHGRARYVATQMDPNNVTVEYFEGDE